MNDIKQEIGVKLKSCRQAKSMTQAEVANALNIPQQQYMRYEVVKHFPSIENLIDLCNFFEVSADYLLGLKEY